MGNQAVGRFPDRMIRQPKAVDEMYNKLPEGKYAGIERRDAPK